MTALNANILLDIADKGHAWGSVKRSLYLLSAAWPDLSFEQWAQCSVGKRDTALLDLREILFGARLEGLAYCPHCRESMEFDFTTADIRAESGTEASEFHLQLPACRVSYRLPDSTDLLAALDAGAEGGAALQTLLARCITAVQGHDGLPSGLASLSAADVSAIQQQMASQDPQAEVSLAVSCPHCSHQTQIYFDIAEFLWSEIQAWSLRIIREVHQLALQYGWHEADILNMSAKRRRNYLDLLNS